MQIRYVLAAILLQFVTIVHPVQASEYLGNNQRTGYADATVPAKPALLWIYKERHTPKTAWPEPFGELQFIDFDYSDQVTIGKGMAYFGSSADHTVRALDVNSGKEQWVFYTEGPVRFAPVLYKDRLCAVSDDGHLYCLKASDGSLIWKRRLAPSGERCIGNEQMVSKWPCRSGVLIEGDKLYTTAGMWSADGVIIYCLNADTGEVIWKNDTTGYRWMLLPHGSGYGGVSPQGYLALYKETLYVAAGRSAPAIFDAKTGKLLFHEIGLGYKAHYPGGSWTMAAHDWVMFKRQHNYKDTDVTYIEYEIGRNAEGIILYNYRTGNPEVALIGGRIVGAAIEGDLILAGESVIRINANELRERYKTDKSTKKQKGSPQYYDPTPLAKWNTDTGRIYTLAIAGETIIAGGKGTITFLDVKSGRKLWQKKVDGSVRGLSVSEGTFIASTTSGSIYCFGKGASDSAPVVPHRRSAPAGTQDASFKVIEEIGTTEGYCLMLGAGDGLLLFDLLKQTKLTVYCLEPDSAKRNKLRALLDEAGMLGTRAQLHDGSFDEITYAPYSGNCIIWGSKLGSPPDKVDFKGLYRSLRPWGGVAYEFADKRSTSASKSKLATNGIPEKEIAVGSFGIVVKRGPLPGAGEWNRSHANPGNTFSSGDDIVKLPLGILWWGGVGPERIVSRHWRAPVPLFSKGHMFIQGQHDIIGVDAYTGREMWNRHIEDIGRFPPTFRGGNIITDGNRVYCVKGLTCYALDAKTGKTVRQYTHTLTPEQEKEAKKLIPLHGVLTQKVKSGKYDLRNPSVVWEFLGMAGNRMIGTLGFDAANLKHNGLAIPNQTRYIFAYDKTTGTKAWEIKLDKTVMPTAIVSDDKNLYFIDRTDEWTYRAMRWRKSYKNFSSRLVAVRLSDGKTVWTYDELNPQRKALLLKDGVIVASANFSEDQTDMNAGLSAFRAVDGKLLWNEDNPGGLTKGRRGGPVRKVFIVGDTLYTPRALDLRTGKPKLVCEDPLTGKPSQFQLSGQNFCGTVAAGNHILAYRSTGLGFKSLTENAPCYWLSEKRTSCWISLLPAGGIVLSPEGASTCVCSFNYKTSLALIPVERHESWGIYLKGSELGQGTGSAWKGAERIVGRPRDFSQLRLNLNAPGDHYDKTTDGNFLAWPQVTRSGKGFIVVPVEGNDDAKGFRFNSDFTPIAGIARPWIYSSGLTGEIKLKVLGVERKAYRVLLHFMETEQLQKGERVFDVLINDKRVLPQLDIIGETGAQNKALVKEVKEIGPSTTVEFSLKHVSGKPPLLCAIELIPK
jgi:outer membrane protein assembly factor BamB